ncbi:hypothetical protein BCR36DRAFT_320368 [Piromyces finnis]|uniref:PH domain-containing protein n=1 Tax=Piromyces finnis TaxID=1754191 RepID=A0A1Y1VHN3_9FUNG|nr:hypothetical protein BCR36DRAFT_320368 [Piromyces finnis]|eukprot:ORX55843.1 hypothetical protein BCR36DRAFT_320368 [Piromyces finnis]
MNQINYSSIDEPLVLTGKIYHKDSILKSRPYLMLCLPISIDDCFYIYNKLSNIVNYSLDPNAPLYLGHLTIAAINGEAVLIVLNSNADLSNPLFIHFSNVSYISSNDRKYSIKINSDHPQQSYEFSCNGGAEYDKWLHCINQAFRITKGELGRKLRFCSILFNKEFNNKNNVKLIKNENLPTVKRIQNCLKKENYIESIENIPKPNPPVFSLSNNPDDSFNYNYLCSEKYIENYNKEKENESKLSSLDNKESSKTLLDDLKDDKITQSFNPSTDDITRINQDSNHGNTNPISSLPNNKVTGLSDITPVNYGTMNSHHKISVMNQPIINNNINVINPSIPGFNSLLNPTTSNTFNSPQGIHYSSIQPADSSSTLVNNNSSITNPNSLPIVPPVQISSQSTTTNQISSQNELTRQPVFYNPSPTSDANVYNDINNALYNKKGTNLISPHTLPRIPAFYNSSIPSSPTNLNKPNGSKQIELSSPHTLPRSSLFYKQSSGNKNNYANSVPNLNQLEINTTNTNTPKTIPKYPDTHQQSPSLPSSPSSSTSSTRFNRQYEERNKTLPRTSKSAEQPKKKFQSLPRYNSYKVTITRFKSIFSNSKHKVNKNTNSKREKHNSIM